jgi:hypothetical protein
VTEPKKQRTPEEQERRRRRQELLDALKEGAELRARLAPRAGQLAKARALLHNRTTRG